MSSSDELEKLAAKYAIEAVQLDRQGSAEMAISRYQRAIELLLKLSILYPEAPQKEIYLNRANTYRNRIEELKSHGLEKRWEIPGDERNLEELVITEKPNVKWSDIADLEDAKKAIEEALIFPVKRPDLFPLGWPRGILFYGPPGCGKTLLASAVATEIEAVFYCVDAASLMSKWLGESEKNVAQLFKEARSFASKGQPAIIFIDEIDSIIGKRTSEVGGEVRTKNQLLKEMDGLLDKSRNLHLYVIGATNKPWILDEAFIRRFQRRVYVPLPGFQARVELFKIHTRNLSLSRNVNLAELARMTEGYSGSDIKDIIQTAHIRVVREFFERGNPNDRRVAPRPITQEDFLNIMERRRPSVSKDLVKSYELWSQQFTAF
ncbi:MAG: AAA family ATPase [Candidatus Bathyarchaeia archaeon]